jgi:hypothetical protein
VTSATRFRVENEEFVEEVLIAPSERVVIDVLLDRAGEFALEHRTPDRTYGLGTVRMSERPIERSYEREFGALRHSEELAAERERLEADLDQPPDKTLALVGEMPGMGHHGEHGHGHHGQGHGEHDAGADVGVVRETMQPANVSRWLRPDPVPKGSEGG